MLGSQLWASPGGRNLPSVKVATAPVMDGQLTDEVWKQAPVATDFIINQPEYGQPSRQRTEVRLLYTDEAIYIGAYLHDNPALIRRQLTSRDEHAMQDTDMFGVLLDTYQDNQNAFAFLVSAANVQSDARVSGGGGNSGKEDFAWDAVWDSHVVLQPDGWTVEIKIPYMALRFAPRPLQDWGINFYRFIRRSNENSYWNPVNPSVNGLVNQSGNLQGLQNLQPPLRLSFLPYVSTGYRHVPMAGGARQEWLRSGGMDVKYGINESFTLDMTLVPDFGQVQSDNVVLNLSPFEIQFAENRPFFTEGTEMFNRAGIFYSRRVGATPSGYYRVQRLAADSGYTIESNPTITQLYNASKFSGRTQGNLGIGIFNAVGAPMYAMLKDKQGNTFKEQTEVLTNYNVLVLDKAFTNRSSVTFTNTNVWRAGNAPEANVSALDVSLFNKSNTWQVELKPRFSHIGGPNGYNGFKNILSAAKVSGAWQYGLLTNVESDGYNPNDLGILRAPNEISATGWVNWQQFTPNKKFNYRKYSLEVVQEYLYKPFAYVNNEIEANFLHVFKNFWDLSLVINTQPWWQNDYFDLRTPGRYYKRTPWAFVGLFGSTDSRKPLFVNYGIGYANLSPIKNDAFDLVRLGVRYRFNTRFSLNLQTNRENDRGNIGYSHHNANGSPIIGLRHNLNISSTLSGIYNFKARMNLTFRARHYWSRVQYKAFYMPTEDGWWKDHPYETGNDKNFNVFNLDAFFTWDFRLGSRLIIAWKNALAPDEVIEPGVHNKYAGNLIRTLSLPHSNELTARFIYFFDVNQLRKKKT